MIFDFFFVKRKKKHKKRNFQSFRNIFLAIELLHLPIHWKGLNLSASTCYSLAVFLAHLQPISITLLGKQVLNTPSRWFYLKKMLNSVFCFFMVGWLLLIIFLVFENSFTWNRRSCAQKFAFRMEEVLCNCILNVNSDNYSDLIYEAINTFPKLSAVVKKKKEVGYMHMCWVIQCNLYT